MGQTVKRIGQGLLLEETECESFEGGKLDRIARFSIEDGGVILHRDMVVVSLETRFRQPRQEVRVTWASTSGGQELAAQMAAMLNAAVEKAAEYEALAQ